MNLAITDPFKIQNIAKTTFKDIDLYGIDVFLGIFINEYSHVAYWNDKIHKLRAPIFKSSGLSVAAITEISKVIWHKNGETTIQTNRGFLKFLNYTPEED